MKNIQRVELNKLTKEELLPEFSTDFPMRYEESDSALQLDPIYLLGSILRCSQLCHHLSFE